MKKVLPNVDQLREIEFELKFVKLDFQSPLAFLSLWDLWQSVVATAVCFLQSSDIIL